MREAFDRKSDSIDSEILEYALARSVDGKMHTMYEGMYQKYISKSSDREFLLKFAAESEEDIIDEDWIIRNGRACGVKNPGQILRGWTVGKEPLLIRETGSFVRFVDPAFRVYAKVRTWRFKHHEGY